VDEATTNTQRLEDALIDVIERLSEVEPTEAVKAALTEAERYREEMSVWEREPPDPMIMSNTLSEVAQLLGRMIALVPKSGKSKKKPKSAPKLELDLELDLSGGALPDSPRVAIGRLNTLSGGGPAQVRMPRAERTGTMAGVGGHELSAMAGIAAPAAVRIHGLQWEDAGNQGVSVKVLHEQRIRTVLVHIAENSELPGHRHQSTETVYVIDGSVFLGATQLQAEETCTFQHDTVSPAIRTEQGAVLLLMNSDRPGLGD
jgi:hypothetical protein